MSTTAEQTVQMIDPALILADDNIRFGIKKYRVDSLAQNIAEVGGVQTALKLTSLTEAGPNGEIYRVREGHYRLAALHKLAKEGKEFQAPCIVEETGAEGVERLKLQLAENIERESLSPMDTAVAIGKLVDAGVPKADIRNLFKSAGGRKGLSMQPLSNSMMNIYLTFLEFPKSVQNKIHDGILRVGAAYELAKYAKDNGLNLKDEKVTKILERAEADRQAEIDADEKMEENFLAAERKADEARAKAEQEASAIKAAEELANKAKQTAQERQDAAAEKYKAKATVSAADKEAAAKAEEAFKAAEKDAKAAQKVAAEAQAALDKMKEKQEKAAAAAEERRKKLEDARRQAAAQKPIGAQQIQSAAAAVDGGPQKLKGPEMYKVVAGVANTAGSYPKAQKVFQAILRCFDGITTDAQMYSEVAYHMGERKEKPKTLKD